MKAGERPQEPGQMTNMEEKGDLQLKQNTTWKGNEDTCESNQAIIMPCIQGGSGPPKPQKENGFFDHMCQHL